MHKSPVYTKTILGRPRINNQIIALEVRVIGEKGENLGVMPKEEALRLTRPEEGLDLIEIVPQAKPPVVRLMSFDKYRYEREKAEKKERLAQKTTGLKRVQISARSAQNDLLTRLKKLEEFLGEGHTVEIQLELRGREKRNREWANHKLGEFLKMIPVEFKVLMTPRTGGRGMIMQIARK